MKSPQYSPSFSSPVTVIAYLRFHLRTVPQHRVMGLIFSCVLSILRLPLSLLLPHPQLFSSLLADISSTYKFSNISHIKATTRLALYALQLPPHFYFSVFKQRCPERLHTCSLLLPFSLEHAPIRFFSGPLFTYILPESIFSHLPWLTSST